jgi:hypothetical protein
MPVGFLFWNLNKKSLQNSIANLAFMHDIDVIMLAECAIPPEILLEALNRDEKRGYYFYVEQLGCTKIQIFTRFSKDFITPAFDELDRMTIRRLQLPGQTEILLAIAHFPGKPHFAETDQLSESFRFVEEIVKTEARENHSRTVVVGDLNMEPFDDGMVTANAFHGTMCRKVAGKRSRIVQDREYQFFYNPMWNLLGDDSNGPPGTYYYHKAAPKTLFWHMFDQVLIRPDLIDRFPVTDLKILTGDGQTSFLKNGFPDKAVASDHLPIVFRLNL